MKTSRVFLGQLKIIQNMTITKFRGHGVENSIMRAERHRDPVRLGDGLRRCRDLALRVEGGRGARVQFSLPSGAHPHTGQPADSGAHRRGGEVASGSPWSVGEKFGSRQSLSASALEAGFVRSSLNRFSESREVTFQFVLQSLVVKL